MQGDQTNIIPEQPITDQTKQQTPSTGLTVPQITNMAPSSINKTLMFLPNLNRPKPNLTRPPPEDLIDVNELLGIRSIGWNNDPREAVRPKFSYGAPQVSDNEALQAVEDMHEALADENSYLDDDEDRNFFDDRKMTKALQDVHVLKTAFPASTVRPKLVGMLKDQAEAASNIRPIKKPKLSDEPLTDTNIAASMLQEFQKKLKSRRPTTNKIVTEQLSSMDKDKAMMSSYKDIYKEEKMRIFEIATMLVHKTKELKEVRQILSENYWIPKNITMKSCQALINSLAHLEEKIEERPYDVLRRPQVEEFARSMGCSDIDNLLEKVRRGMKYKAMKDVRTAARTFEATEQKTNILYNMAMEREDDKDAARVIKEDQLDLSVDNADDTEQVYILLI
jgi:hypothetical protein